jgi:hypothetical protein
MQLILPDVLATARGLSAGAAGFLVLVGFLMWAAGWRWHRFWVVFGLTLAAGIVGLGAGSASGGGQVMVVGVLLAVAAGMLALELSKILAFVTGGAAAWVATQALLPQAQELWAVFLSGGLIGVVLYRLWTMLTTSFLGVLLAWHAGLVLIEPLAGADTAKWAGEHAAALNGAVIAVTVIGVLVQAQTTPRPDEAAEDETGTPTKVKPTADEVVLDEAKKPAWWRLSSTRQKAA